MAKQKPSEAVPALHELQTLLATSQEHVEKALVLIVANYEAAKSALGKENIPSGLGFSSYHAHLWSFGYRLFNWEGGHLTEKQLLSAYKAMPKYANKYRQLLVAGVADKLLTMRDDLLKQRAKISATRTPEEKANRRKAWKERQDAFRAQREARAEGRQATLGFVVTNGVTGARDPSEPTEPTLNVAPKRKRGRPRKIEIVQPVAKPTKLDKITSLLAVLRTGLTEIVSDE